MIRGQRRVCWSQQHTGVRLTLTEQLRDVGAEDRPSKVEERVGIAEEETVNAGDSLEKLGNERRNMGWKLKGTSKAEAEVCLGWYWCRRK